MKNYLFILCTLVCLAVFAGETPMQLNTSTGTLHGTLSVPEGKVKFPLVILIAGSGPTDRDGNNPIMKNNSLKMISEGLTKEGIAVFRFDKRGIAASENAMKAEKDLVFDDYITDVLAWVNLLEKDNRFSEIVLAGHSEGSLIGMLAATKSNSIKKYISIAGAGIRASDIIKKQIESQPAFVQEIVSSKLDSLEKGDTLRNVDPMLYTLFRPSIQPYMISWIKYDPAEIIAKLNIPVLIIQGGKDIQVGPENAEALAKGNPKAKRVDLPEMNHVLKSIDTMDMEAQMKTYSEPERPLDAELIPAIAAFVKS